MQQPASDSSSPMPAAAAKEILDTMLGYLGFVVDIREDEFAAGPALQIFTEEADALIGRRGDRLDDIQYLANRLLQVRMPDAPRVRVDVAHYRTMREDSLLERVRRAAERVRATRRPVRLSPMNAYYRRLVHNALKDDPDVITWSPKESSRVKRITLKPRPGKGTGRPSPASKGPQPPPSPEQ